jgi:hypothetical protein
MVHGTDSCDSRARKYIVMANKTQSRHGAMVCGTAVTAEPEEQNVTAAPAGMYIYTYLRLFSATTLLACTGVELTAWRSARRLQAVPAGKQGLATFATTLLAGTGVAARRSPRRLQAVPAGMTNPTCNRACPSEQAHRRQQALQQGRHRRLRHAVPHCGAQLPLREDAAPPHNLGVKALCTKQFCRTEHSVQTRNPMSPGSGP